MATRRYKLSVGESEFQVTEEAGAAVNSDTVELTVECATTAINEGASTRQPHRSEVLDALNHIKNHIIKSNWPPV
ncbi:MAG: hypothetical protein SGJ18_15125 [Pseudomonadota bacterium]|nr:hypothetical protein [Pseudomonadota bacterium]